MPAKKGVLHTSVTPLRVTTASTVSLLSPVGLQGVTLGSGPAGSQACSTTHPTAASRQLTRSPGEAALTVRDAASLTTKDAEGCLPPSDTQGVRAHTLKGQSALTSLSEPFAVASRVSPPVLLLCPSGARQPRVGFPTALSSAQTTTRRGQEELGALTEPQPHHSDQQQTFVPYPAGPEPDGVQVPIPSPHLPQQVANVSTGKALTRWNKTCGEPKAPTELMAPPNTDQSLPLVGASVGVAVSSVPDSVPFTADSTEERVPPPPRRE